MTCADVKDLLPRHQHGRLSADDAAIVDRHVAGCAACAAERAVGERLDGVLAAAFSDHPFDDAAELVAQVREASARNHARAGRVLRPTGPWAAAAAVGLLALGLGLARHGEPSVEPVHGPAERVEVARAGTAGLRRVTVGEVAEPLGPDARIREGDRLVAVGAEAQVRLEDGTRIEVAPDTEVALRRDADGGQTLIIGSQDGEVYCEVAKRQRPLRVEARGLQVEVVGTRFVVHQGVHAARVVVLEGRVVATSASDRRILGVDEGVESREGEPLFTLVRLDANVGLAMGRWVPRLRQELEQRFASATTPAPPPAEPPPLPSLPPPTIDPGLDTPVAPPDDAPAPVGSH